LYAAREKTVAEIGELFGITRETVHRYVKTPKADTTAAKRPKPKGA
jgi:predicted transcriptional regulator